MVLKVFELEIQVCVFTHILRQITDFGACRPVSAEARAQLLRHCEQVIDIRNGNWKEEARESEGERESSREVKELFSADHIRSALREEEQRYSALLCMSISCGAIIRFVCRLFHS